MAGGCMQVTRKRNHGRLNVLLAVASALFLICLLKKEKRSKKHTKGEAQLFHSIF